MKTKVLAAALLAGAAVLATGPTLAQDASFDWTGGYAGLFGSGNRSDIGLVDVDDFFGSPSPIVDFSVDGWDFGGLAGYNFQRGNLVYGVELSLAGGGAEGNLLLDKTELDETLEWKVKSSATLTARVGTTVGNTLFFGSAGVARSKVNYGYLNYEPDLVTITDDARIDSTFNGTVLGIGLEHAFSQRMIFRAEVLHSRYSGQMLDLVPLAGVRIRYSPTNTAVRVGLLFSF